MEFDRQGVLKKLVTGFAAEHELYDEIERGASSRDELWRRHDEYEPKLESLRRRMIDEVFPLVADELGYADKDDLGVAIYEAELDAVWEVGGDSEAMAEEVLVELENRRTFKFGCWLEDHDSPPMAQDLLVVVDSPGVTLSLTQDPSGGARGVHVLILGSIGANSSARAHIRTDEWIRALFGAGVALGLFQPKQGYPLKNAHIVLAPEDEQAERSYLDPLLASAIKSTRMAEPRDFSASSSDPGIADVRAVASSGRLEPPHFRTMIRALNSKVKRGVTTRIACRFLGHALASRDPGWSLFYCALCLEALLLDSAAKEDLTARLGDAVAAQQGGSEEQRNMHRNMVRDIYDARSSVVHRGEYRGKSRKLKLEPRQLSEQATELVSAVLHRELHESL